ncbi:MAG: hypothetical protein ACREIP_16780 [Alphaproteobacteria bacterium]
MGTTQDRFIERLRNTIIEHEARAERLENGREKAHRRDRAGKTEDISLTTADHYRRLVTHLKEVVARHDARSGK